MFAIRSLVLGLALVAVGEASAGTLLVPAQYSTIQSAIDAAQSGDTVSVSPGVYVEGVVMKGGVTLKGAGWKTTVIDGAEGGNVISITGADVATFVIEGFTLRNSEQSGSGFSNNGVFVNGNACCSVVSDGSIRDCRIEHCGKGVYITNVHAGTITIERNQIVDILHRGVSAFFGATTVRNNTIAFCGSSGYQDNAGGGGPFLVENNVIAYNGGYGVRSNHQTPITVQYNDVYGNVLGPYWQSSGAGSSWNPSPGTNFQASPSFEGEYPFNVHLKAGSPCIDAGNPATKDADGTTADVGALWYDATHVPPVTDPFGAGCGGLQLTATGTPWAGSFGRFELGFAGAPPATTVFLLAGLSGATWGGLSLPYDFGAAAPGCELLAVPTLLVGLPSGATGALTIPLPLPNDAASIGVPLDLQWAAAAPGANPLGFVFSEGLHLTIGN